jgi:hypothetical protein
VSDLARIEQLERQLRHLAEAVLAYLDMRSAPRCVGLRRLAERVVAEIGRRDSGCVECGDSGIRAEPAQPAQSADGTPHASVRHVKCERCS